MEMACGRITFLAISMVVVSSVVMATTYTVGDEKGWTPDFNYTKWTQDKVFRVGDSLVFQYNASRHNVVKVNGIGFNNCDNSTSEKVNGTDNFHFPGRKWYICDIDDHCSAHQMKLVVDVADDGPAPPPTSAAYAVVSSIYGVLVAATIGMATMFA